MDFTGRRSGRSGRRVVGDFAHQYTQLTVTVHSTFTHTPHVSMSIHFLRSNANKCLTSGGEE